MDPNNLVSLQNSTKKIRNPFGFDFTAKWAKKPVTIPGDGQWYSMIGPLADHIANHLYMKIRYQFHDEQTAALRAKGDDRGARGYNVPAEVENKIWMLITGLPKHSNIAVADEVQNEADLSILKAEMSKMEKRAATNSGPVNVSKILEKATVEALPTASMVDGKEASGHVDGSGRLSDEPVEDIDTTPINVADLQNNPEAVPVIDTQENKSGEIPVLDPAPAQEAQATQTDASEFADVAELDNNEQPATAPTA